MCENPQAIYDLADILKKVLPFALKLFPIASFPLILSCFIRFIRDCASDRRAYNCSWHVTRNKKPSDYSKYDFENSDCAAWVKEFEEKEDISIYG